MKVLIAGACGFVGHCLAGALAEAMPGLELAGVDNLSRPGSEINRRALPKGAKYFHGDLRSAADVASLPAVDWVIDAAANPSVLAGVGDATTSRQLVEHNLLGTTHLLEYCKTHRAGLILLSTSRVYSIPPLANLPVEARDRAYQPKPGAILPPGLSAAGVSESFSTAAPISLYGATKLASECLALEYGLAFNFPVWINRCGVLAGAGQFGKADQGIFAFWINSHLRRRPLKFIGFSGQGFQTRDCLHPRDLAPLIVKQMTESPGDRVRIQNVSGGLGQSMSLARLHAWCDAQFGAHPVQADPSPRQFDIPWMVLDSTLAAKQWSWRATTPLESILKEIAQHAERNPHWLDFSVS